MVPALLMVVLGLVLLILLALRLRGPSRRLARARAALRRALAPRVATLRALADARVRRRG